MGLKGLEAQSQIKDDFKCTTCKVRCPSQNGLEQHYFGKQHLYNMKILKAKQKDRTKEAEEKDLLQATPNASVQDPEKKNASAIPTSRPSVQDPEKKKASSIHHSINSILKARQKVGTNEAEEKELLQATPSASVQEPEKKKASAIPTSRPIVQETEKKKPSAIPTSRPKIVMPDTGDLSPIRKPPKPLQGKGDGLRHQDNKIECTLCGMHFKSTSLFARHCSTSEDHQKAIARSEEKMKSVNDVPTEDVSNTTSSDDKSRVNRGGGGKDCPTNVAEPHSQQIPGTSNRESPCIDENYDQPTIPHQSQSENADQHNIPHQSQSDVDQMRQHQQIIQQQQQQQLFQQELLHQQFLQQQQAYAHLYGAGGVAPAVNLANLPTPMLPSQVPVNNIGFACRQHNIAQLQAELRRQEAMQQQEIQAEAQRQAELQRQAQMVEMHKAAIAKQAIEALQRQRAEEMQRQAQLIQQAEIQKKQAEIEKQRVAEQKKQEEIRQAAEERRKKQDEMLRQIEMNRREEAKRLEEIETTSIGQSSSDEPAQNWQTSRLKMQIEDRKKKDEVIKEDSGNKIKQLLNRNKQREKGDSVLLEEEISKQEEELSKQEEESNRLLALEEEERLRRAKQEREQQEDERRRIEQLLWKEKRENENLEDFPTLPGTNISDEQSARPDHKTIVEEQKRILMDIKKQAEDKKKREEEDRHLVEELERQNVMNGALNGIKTIQQKMEEDNRRREMERIAREGQEDRIRRLKRESERKTLMRNAQEKMKTEDDMRRRQVEQTRREALEKEGEERIRRAKEAERKRKISIVKKDELHLGDIRDNTEEEDLVKLTGVPMEEDFPDLLKLAEIKRKEKQDQEMQKRLAEEKLEKEKQEKLKQKEAKEMEEYERERRQMAEELKKRRHEQELEFHRQTVNLEEG